MQIAAIVDSFFLSPARFLVHGCSGTGKTELITRIACQTHARSSDAQAASVLVVVPNSVAKNVMEQKIAAACRQDNIDCVQQGPLVRTVHSVASAIVNYAAKRDKQLTPVVVSAFELDAVLHEILMGQIGQAGNPWPAHMHTAMRSDWFSSLLRDFILRAGEECVGPEELEKMGARFSQPSWVAVGKTMREVQEIFSLRTSAQHQETQFPIPMMNSSDLLEIATSCIRNDPEIIAETFGSEVCLAVDDIQQYSMSSGILLSAVSSGSKRTIITRDPQHHIFTWRGAYVDNERFFAIDRELNLGDNARLPQAVAQVANHISRSGKVGSTSAAGEVHIQEYAGVVEQARDIASRLIAARGELSWSDMAIITRSPGIDLEFIVIQLEKNSIPFYNELAPPRVHESPTVASLVLLTTLIDGTITADNLEELAQGPFFYGSDDPRRVTAALRALAGAFGATGFAAEGGTSIKASVEQLSSGPTRSLIEKLYQYSVQPGGEGVLDFLFRLYQESEVSALLGRWQSSERPLAAISYGQSLAVASFFAQLRHYSSDHYVPADPGQECEKIRFHYYSTVANSAVANPYRDAVTITTAHASTGREWELVVVCGLQEDRWPNPWPRKDILDMNEFIILMHYGDNIQSDPNTYIDHYSINLLEERDLFHVAITRARSILIVCAVNNSSGVEALVPSQFFTEVQAVSQAHTGADTALKETPPGYTYTHLVRILRHALLDPMLQAESEKKLAYLAKRGVRQAMPQYWWSLGDVSTHLPTTRDKTSIVLSPSMMHTLQQCPFCWFFSTLISARSPEIMKGNIIHLAAEYREKGLSVAKMMDIISEVIAHYWPSPAWLRLRFIESLRDIVFRLAHYFTARARQYELCGVEVAKGVLLGGFHDSGHDYTVELRGRLDRLDRSRQTGTLHVLDIKTSAVAITKEAARQHLQLLAYRRLVDPELDCVAEIYYPCIKSIKPTMREQNIVQDASEYYDDDWVALAKDTIGPVFAVARDPDHTCMFPLLDWALRQPRLGVPLEGDNEQSSS